MMTQQHGLSGRLLLPGKDCSPSSGSLVWVSAFLLAPIDEFLDPAGFGIRVQLRGTDSCSQKVFFSLFA